VGQAVSPAEWYFDKLPDPFWRCRITVRSPPRLRGGYAAITTTRRFFPQYYPSHTPRGSLPVAPAGTIMGRMTNCFLASLTTGCHSTRARNYETNPRPPVLASPSRPDDASLFARDALPLNASQKLRNEPKASNPAAPNAMKTGLIGLRNLRNYSLAPAYPAATTGSRLESTTYSTRFRGSTNIHRIADNT
jgi:hypothetical protein